MVECYWKPNAKCRDLSHRTRESMTSGLLRGKGIRQGVYFVGSSS